MSDLEKLMRRAEALAGDARADSTRQMQMRLFSVFERWCRLEGLVSIPASAEDVALFLFHGHRCGWLPATTTAYAQAVGQAHRQHRQPDPCSTSRVRDLLKAVARNQGLRPQRAKTPVRQEGVEALVERPLQWEPDDVPAVQLRGQASLLLAVETGFPLRQLVRLERPTAAKAAEGVLSFAAAPRLPGRPQGRGEALPATTMRLGPAGPGVEAARALMRLLDVLPESVTQPLAFAELGAHIQPVPASRATAALRDQLGAAAARAGLEDYWTVDPYPGACLSVDQLHHIVRHCDPRRLARLRDRAYVLLMYAAARRHSEVAALRVEDLTFRAEGVELFIRRSKTDQHGVGATVRVAHTERPSTCAVCALGEWLHEGNITAGLALPPVVGRRPRTDGAPWDRRTASRRVRLLAQSAGLVGDFGTHSFRRGHVTDAVVAGVPAETIIETTLHATVSGLQDYVAFADPFEGVPKLPV
jgi:integrase